MNESSWEDMRWCFQLVDCSEQTCPGSLMAISLAAAKVNSILATRCCCRASNSTGEACCNLVLWVVVKDASAHDIKAIEVAGARKGICTELGEQQEVAMTHARQHLAPCHHICSIAGRAKEGAAAQLLLPVAQLWKQWVPQRLWLLQRQERSAAAADDGAW